MAEIRNQPITESEFLYELFDDICKELERQDIQHGGITHDLIHTRHEWVALIVRALGKAVDSVAYTEKFDAFVYRRFMIQAATLIVAALRAQAEHAGGC